MTVIQQKKKKIIIILCIIEIKIYFFQGEQGGLSLHGTLHVSHKIKKNQ